MRKLFLSISFILSVATLAFAVSSSGIPVFGTMTTRASVPASATTNSGAVCFDLADDGFLFALDADYVSGTPTLDVKIQSSADGVNYYDTNIVFTQVTTTDKYQTISSALVNYGKCFRAVLVSAGTSPVYNAAVRIYSRKVL